MGLPSENFRFGASVNVHVLLSSDAFQLVARSGAASPLLSSLVRPSHSSVLSVISNAVPAAAGLSCGIPDAAPSVIVPPFWAFAVLPVLAGSLLPWLPPQALT